MASWLAIGVISGTYFSIGLAEQPTPEAGDGLHHSQVTILRERSKSVQAHNGQPKVLHQETRDAEIVACASISDTTRRLTCYDELAITRGYQPEIHSNRTTGNWLINESVNPLDDSRTVTLLLPSTPASTQSRTRDRPVLVARCQSNSTEVYINWYQYLGDDSSSVYSNWKRVTVRIGTGDAREERWGISTDNDATFAPSWAGNLLREMLTSDTFIARTTPYSENPMVAIFDTTGLEQALVPLADACGWAIDGSGTE